MRAPLAAPSRSRRTATCPRSKMASWFCRMRFWVAGSEARLQLRDMVAHGVGIGLEHRDASGLGIVLTLQRASLHLAGGIGRIEREHLRLRGRTLRLERPNLGLHRGLRLHIRCNLAL